jgi:type IV pilus assembly protein PilW
MMTFDSASPSRTRAAHRSARAKSAGFSLIELMVAMTIGIIVLLGLVLMLSANSSNQAELEQTIRKLENARYSVDVLSEDIAHAGYYSDFSPDSLPVLATYVTTDPCEKKVQPTTAQGWNISATSSVFPVPVQGLAPGVNPSPVDCLTNRKADTAALVIRHAETGDASTVGGSLSTNLYLQYSRCPADTRRVVVAQGADSALFILKGPDCVAANNSVRRLIQRTYFVATCNVCSPNDGIPTLKRVEIINDTQQISAVAEGIENLRLEYGVDSSATKDGEPDVYVTAPSATDWPNVVTVRIHILARNNSKTAGYVDNRTYRLGPELAVTAPADGYKRTLLTTTSRLNNVAGRRE